MVWYLMGNVKNCERVDIQLEEREKEKKTQGMERGSTRINVGGAERERETRELLRG